MAIIIVFASSLLLASFLVFIRGLELKFGKKNIILELLSKFDTKSERFLHDLKFKCLQLVKSVEYIVFVQAKVVSKDIASRAGQRIVLEYKARQESLMGRKEIKSNGSASFYLKKIDESKKNGERGRIEEELI